MKKSELSFKVATCSDDRRITMFRAFKDKNIDFAPHDKMFIYCTGTFASGGNDGEEYDKSVLPEMTFIEAMNAIESIEPDAPEFDMKLREEVLVSDVDSDIWELCDFARVHTDCFMMIGYGYGQKLIKYEGNEKYHGTTDTPPGWWECENGNPVWKTR